MLRFRQRGDTERLIFSPYRCARSAACVLRRPAAQRFRPMGTQRMFDAANARRLMVEGQIRTADVTDTAVLDAMQALPRERFLPPGLGQLAYLDAAAPVRRGRGFLRPGGVAQLVAGGADGRNDAGGGP